MSQDVVETVLEKIGSDSKFRERMMKDTFTTLDKDYPNKLTEDEKAALKKMVAGFAADLKQAARPWWQPPSFKELGGAFLSLALIALLFWVVAITFGVINVLPQVVKIGDTVQVIDTYSRAKDLLSILFPLFGAVVTFWLGVAVEGKRADQNQETAEKANKDLANVQEKDKNVKVALAGKIGEAKGQAKSQRESIKGRLKAAGEPVTDSEVLRLDAILSSLEEAEKAISS